MGCVPARNVSDITQIFEEILTSCQQILQHFNTFKTPFTSKDGKLFNATHISSIASLKISFTKLHSTYNNLDAIAKDFKFMKENVVRIPQIIKKISELMDMCDVLTEKITRIIAILNAPSAADQAEIQAVNEVFDALTVYIDTSNKGINRSVNACTILAVKEKTKNKDKANELMDGIEQFHTGMNSVHHHIKNIK